MNGLVKIKFTAEQAEKISNAFRSINNEFAFTNREPEYEIVERKLFWLFTVEKRVEVEPILKWHFMYDGFLFRLSSTELIVELHHLVSASNNNEVYVTADMARVFEIEFKI